MFEVLSCPDSLFSWLISCPPHYILRPIILRLAVPPYWLIPLLIWSSKLVFLMSWTLSLFNGTCYTWPSFRLFTSLNSLYSMISMSLGSLIECYLFLFPSVNNKENKIVVLTMKSFSGNPLIDLVPAPLWCWPCILLAYKTEA